MGWIGILQHILPVRSPQVRAENMVMLILYLISRLTLYEYDSMSFNMLLTHIQTGRSDCKCTYAPCMTCHHSRSVSTCLLLASETPLRLPGHMHVSALTDAVDMGRYGTTASCMVGKEVIQQRAGGSVSVSEKNESHNSSNVFQGAMQMRVHGQCHIFTLSH